MKNSKPVFAFLFLAACGVAAGNPEGVKPQKLRIDKRYPPAATTGTPLTLQGRFFGSSPGRVRIGKKNAEVISWSNSEVVVRTPSDPTTACDSVQMFDSEGFRSNQVPFAYGDRGVWLPNSEVPSARERPMMVWTGDELFVWGGGFSSGGRYNPRTDSWLPTSQNGAPKANFPFVEPGHAIWTGKEILVWTGRYDGPGARYDPVDDAWAPINPKGAPVSYGGSSAVWTGTEMIVWTSNGGGRYDPETNRWRPMSQTVEGSPAITAHLKRGYHSAVWTGRSLIIWGGNTIDPPRPLGDGAEYFPGEDVWRPIPAPAHLSPRGYQMTAWTGEEMLVWGGTTGDFEVIPDGSSELSGARYNPTTREWRMLTTKGAPTFSVGSTGVWTGSEWILFGGRNAGEWGLPPIEGGIKYDPSSDRWYPLAVTGQPQTRTNASAVWNGQDMFVWGGIDGSQSPLASGARFRPKDNVWVPIAGVTGEPSPRAGFTTVWTGAELVVWGGQQDHGYFYSEPVTNGGRYNPVTNEWLPVAVTGPVPGVVGHSAVWTGKEMLVWGGSTTAAAYDPAINAWSKLATLGAPVRQRGSAVWTGTRMLVWGGTGLIIPTLPATGSLGAVYQRTTDTWSPMASDGAPDNRQNAHLVWSGTEAFVYGGGGGPIQMPWSNKGIRSGGRYNPETNQWHQIPEAAFLDIGIVNSAVWTGTHFIVIGSHTVVPGVMDGYVAQGGSFDPSTNEWTQLSLEGAPIGQRSSAFWTGSQVLVFSEPDISSGAGDYKGFRYTPEDDRWGLIRCGCGSYVYQPVAASEGATVQAVWTGSVVQLWGAYGGVSYVP